MFNWSNGNPFSFFILDEEGNKKPVSEWSINGISYFGQINILTEMVDNGLAVFNNDSCEVEITEILRLSDVDKQILNLPSTYPYEIYIQSDGQLNQSNFKFKYGFYDFAPNGNRFMVNRNGAVIEVDNHQYLLSSNQFQICDALDNFNSLSEHERTFQNNLKCFADIKTLSKEAASLLDSYLQNQNVVHPDKIKIELDFSEGVLEIIPSIDIENQSGFVRAFDLFPSIKDVYQFADANGTTRVVIDEGQKVELSRIKRSRKISDKNTISQIVENPEQFFDDLTTDYSVFYSERVKEIGLYKPKFYPFVCPYKSEWIPGISVKDKVHGEKKIYFKTESDLVEFEKVKDRAQSLGKRIIEWKGTEIPIEDAENFIQIAKRQFANPREPAPKIEGNSRDEVLIIKENAEFLEYDETRDQPLEIAHSFSQIRNSSISLKDHQVEGIAWLQSLHKESLVGCLLADDMGLGKTLQILYFIEWHAQHTIQSKPYLVVAPVSLLENWENEYNKFFSPKTLFIKKLYGKIDFGKEFDEEINKRDAKTLQFKHIILTNYETLREYQAVMCLVDFAIVVLDEAQRIKTPGTLITNASKALKADFKIAMTGTPVENTLVDLWCIMDFSVPGLLGNARDFAKEFQNPLEKEETNLRELGASLRNRIGVFIKRRLKIDVAKDLPSKIEHKTLFYQRVMPPVQLERYKVEIELAKSADLSGVDRRNQILKSLWAIRDITDHPFLIDSQIVNFKTDELVSASAKLQVLCDVLEEVKAKDEKVIVFADRKETQRLLQKVVSDSFGIKPSIVNGETPTIQKYRNGFPVDNLSRQATIDRFQAEDGFNVIIMSQLAAGVGLNVTKANHVIHYSRHWNPAKEAQATDRAYRIGQTKDVHVYYPMAVFPSDMKNEDGSQQKSFDQILDNLLSIKTSLANNTLFPTEQAEVKPEEIFCNVFGFSSNVKPTPLTIEKIDKLNPNLFEAYVAALFSARGFNVHLTPNSNDKGADVVAVSESESFLIQVKQTISTVDVKAVQEIFTAKKYYQERYDQDFKLMVVSNGVYTPAAEMLSRVNQVRLIGRIEFQRMVSEKTITIQDVNSTELLRLQRI
jgi:SNF2 family DNA or RNA helicase/HJR/Mrr/RecB family endonuclease